MITARSQLKAFNTCFAILMLFITFFTRYLFLGVSLMEAFVHGIVSYVVTTIVLQVLIGLWMFAFAKDEWKHIAEINQEQDKILLEKD